MRTTLMDDFWTWILGVFRNKYRVDFLYPELDIDEPTCFTFRTEKAANEKAIDLTRMHRRMHRPDGRFQYVVRKVA